MPITCSLVHYWKDNRSDGPSTDYSGTTIKQTTERAYTIRACVTPVNHRQIASRPMKSADKAGGETITTPNVFPQRYAAFESR